MLQLKKNATNKNTIVVTILLINNTLKRNEPTQLYGQACWAEEGSLPLFLTGLFSDQLVKHSPKFLMDFLHFIDMTCNLVHSLDGH